MANYYYLRNANDKGKEEKIEAILLITLLFWYLAVAINVLTIWIFKMWRYDHKILQYYYYKREYKQLSDEVSDNADLV